MDRADAVKRVLQQLDSLDADSLSEYFCLILQASPSVTEIASALQLYIGHTAYHSYTDEIANAIVHAYTTGVVQTLHYPFNDAGPTAEAVTTSSPATRSEDAQFDSALKPAPSSAETIKSKRIKGKFVKSSALDVTNEFFSSTGTDLSNVVSLAEHPVCRHFLSGLCLRKDCPFLHNTSNVPCRFWTSMQGCNAGDSCPFRHDIALPETAHGAEPAHGDEVEDVMWAMREVADFTDAENPTEALPPYDELFPAALPSATSTTPISATSTTPIAELKARGPTQAQLIALMSLQSTFPTLSQSQLQEGLRKAGNDHTKAVSWLENAFAVRPVVPESVTPGKHASSSRWHAHEAQAKLIARSLEWVETGSTVSALYTAHRCEAEVHARSRNNLLRLATEAYLAGRSAEAARLSREGRALDAKMRGSHLLAAQSIHAARNADDTSAVQNIHGHSVCPLDLHGLHGNEVVTVVRDALTRISASTSSRTDDVWVACLVGTRHHSKKLGKGGGSIQSSLIRYLEEAGWEYYDGAEDGGVLLVRVAGYSS